MSSLLLFMFPLLGCTVRLLCTQLSPVVCVAHFCVITHIQLSIEMLKWDKMRGHLGKHWLWFICFCSSLHVLLGNFSVSRCVTWPQQLREFFCLCFVSKCLFLFFSSVNFCVVLVSAYYLEQVTIDMFQIAYFYTKYYIFWVRVRKKSVITEACTKREYYAQNSPVCSNRQFTLLTNSILEYLMPHGISILANISISSFASFCYTGTF